MSQFNEQSWNHRYSKMGDEAENVFEQVATSMMWGWTRYGLNRPEMRLENVPRMICYTPDYLTEFGFVEVQGVGQDQTIKIKIDKLEALRKWDSISDTYQVSLFLWDRTNQMWTMNPIRDYDRNNCDTAGFFHEGKAWLGWNVTSFPNWTPLESTVG